LQRQIRYFEMQKERNPRSRHFLALADLHRRSGDPTLAVAILTDGLARCSDSISARYVLGMCLLETGDTAGADDQFRQVLALDPQHILVGEALAKCAGAKDQVVETPLPEPEAAPLSEADPLPEADPSPETMAEPETPPAESVHVPTHDSEPIASAEAAEESEAPEEPVTPAEPAPVAAAADTRQDDTIPSMFVTRTLADIYLSQGHKDKALRILYQVLAAHPEREDIVASIAELEQKGGPAASAADIEPDEVGDDDKDANRRRFDDWVEKTRGDH
jgi:tetratricopeptide (TPR) repeat protein